MIWLFAAALAQDLVLEGEVPAEGTYSFLPFEVPEGTAELGFTHRATGDGVVTDWGLVDPAGDLRGWAGSLGTDVVVGASAASPGYRTGPLPAGTWRVLLGVPERASDGTYTVGIDLREAATVPTDPDRGELQAHTVDGRGAGWFAGDFHVHSIQSGDARPSMDEVASFAASVGLDFVELSEHNTTAHLQLLSAVQGRHPEVLLMPGVEWTTYGGHANVIGLDHAVPFHVGLDGLTAQAAVDEARAGGALFGPTHPALTLGALCYGCAWVQEVAPESMDVIEIQTTSIDGLGTILLEGALALWDDWCDQGVHVAAVGGSDDHSGGEDGIGIGKSPIGSPTTLVHAASLSAADLMVGVRDSRTVVKLGGPADPMVILEADGREGDSVEADAGRFTARVEGGEGMRLEWVRDGAVVSVLPVESDPFEAALDVAAPADGSETRVRLHLVHASGVPRTITSHVWLRRGPEDTGEDTAAPALEPEAVDACGCAQSRPGMLWLPWGLVLLGCRRRSCATLRVGGGAGR